MKRWVGYAACLNERSCACRVLVGKPTENTWKTPVYMEGNIKMDLNEIKEEGID